MGVCIAKCVIPCVSKGKTETVSSSAQTLWEIGATDIDGNKYATLRELIPEGRLAVVVNVATKCGLATWNYNEMKKLKE